VSNRLSRLLTEPLIQFLFIGAAIYGAYALLGTPEENFRDTTVHVDANRINAFISQWESRWNRPPTREELGGLIQSYIREDILYRQAVAMGLNEDDPITRRRMAQKLEFLTSDLAMMAEPAEGELETFFEQNQALYRRPDRLTFSQLFFDPDSRGDATLNDAAAVLAELQAAGIPDAESLQAGDQFMLQDNFRAVTESEVSRAMGKGFASEVMKLAPGQWHGPVLSGFGVHLVYVYEHQESPAAVFDEVKPLVLENWHIEKREKFNADFLESLKNRYEIVIDEIPADRILATPDETSTAKNSAQVPAS
jgi:hypothetical protein